MSDYQDGYECAPYVVIDFLKEFGKNWEHPLLNYLDFMATQRDDLNRGLYQGLLDNPRVSAVLARRGTDFIEALWGKQ